MNILVISTIYPLKEINRKKDENDIILITNDSLKRKYEDYNFTYVFPILYVNWLLSLIFPQKKEIYNIIKKRKVFSTNGNIINIFPILRSTSFPKLNKFLMDLSFFLNTDKYKKFIEINKINLVHTHSVSSDGYLAYKIYKKFNIPYVLTIRELNKGNFDQLIIDNALSVISLNGIDHKIVKEKFFKKNTIIPHGIDNRFYQSKKNINTNYKLKFLSVCRLLKLKNLDKVILALKEVKFDFEYDIYGDGPEASKLDNLIKELNLGDKIKMKGKYPNDKINDLYIKYDLFIMPSSPEALGRVYFESMSSSTPVICCQNTGIDGLIKNRIEGILVRKDFIKDDLVIELNNINDNRELLKLMSNNSRKFSEIYNWDSTIETLNEFYKL